MYSAAKAIAERAAILVLRRSKKAVAMASRPEMKKAIRQRLGASTNVRKTGNDGAWPDATSDVERIAPIARKTNNEKAIAFNVCKQPPEAGPNA